MAKKNKNITNIVVGETTNDIISKEEVVETTEIKNIVEETLENLDKLQDINGVSDLDVNIKYSGGIANELDVKINYDEKLQDKITEKEITQDKDTEEVVEMISPSEIEVETTEEVVEVVVDNKKPRSLDSLSKSEFRLFQRIGIMPK